MVDRDSEFKSIHAVAGGIFAIAVTQRVNQFGRQFFGLLPRSLIGGLARRRHHKYLAIRTGHPYPLMPHKDHPRRLNPVVARYRDDRYPILDCREYLIC